VVRFQCGRCGRHYSVSEELRGRSFKIKCRACGENVVVRPPPLQEVNPFVAEPVTAASAASVVDAAAAREAAMAQAPPVAPPPTARPPGPDELPGHPEWFTDVEAAALASDGLSPAAPSPVEVPPRRSAALEELRRALAEALESPEGTSAGHTGAAAEAPASMAGTGGGAPRVPAAPAVHGGARRDEPAERGRPREPSPVLFRAAARPTAGPVVAVAVATMALVGVVAGVIFLRKGETAEPPRVAPAAVEPAGTSAASAVAEPSPAPPAAALASEVPPAAGPPAAAAAPPAPAPPVAAPPAAVARARALPAAAPPVAVPPAATPPAAPGPAGVAPEAAPRKAPAGKVEAPDKAEAKVDAPGEVEAKVDAPGAVPAKVAETDAAGPAEEPTPPAGVATASSESMASAARPAPRARPRGKPPTPEEVLRVAAANRAAFDACFAAVAAADGGPGPEGRPPTLLATVEPAGEVSFPTLDDVELARSDLGGCLKAAARKMTFAPFDGEAVRIEVPLVPLRSP